MRSRLSVHAVLGALVITLAGGAASAAPAYAEEVYTRPSSGVFYFAGHGWGHGRGLNQWGAQGAATQGQTATQILNAYYPGTSVGALGNVGIRVLLQKDDGKDVLVDRIANLAAHDLSNNGRWALPGGPTQWRFVVDSIGKLRIQGLTSAGWTNWAFGGHNEFTGPLRFEGATPLHLSYPDGTARDYRGTLSAVRMSSTSIATVNTLSMEQYLYGVVPRESPSYFHAEALKAQAVAARSYSAYKIQHVASTAKWDICDSTQCQVYGGLRLYTGGDVIALERDTTNAAVDATRGVVRTYNGAAIFAEYSSSNGGWSTAGSVPYLVARADPWDAIASPDHNWNGQVSVAQLQAKFAAVGTLDRIVVVTRDGHGDWGGRVKTVRLEGHTSSGGATSVTTTGAGVYGANTWPASSSGLRSSWWKVTSAPVPTFTGAVAGVSSGNAVAPVGTVRVWFDIRNTGNLSWPVNGLV
ncbi:MAG: SpoIID/LytB domain-containing protein, partial [Mycobacteriales bacterium]